jgi:hypothetical protein
MFILYYYLYSYVIIMFRFFCEELFIFVNKYILYNMYFVHNVLFGIFYNKCLFCVLYINLLFIVIVLFLCV